MSLPLPGASANDLLNSQNNRMKSIALERTFLLTFFGCSKKVSWTKGFVWKMSGMTVCKAYA